MVSLEGPETTECVHGRAAAERSFGASSAEIRELLDRIPGIVRRYRGCGLGHDELVAAGNLGVAEAALRFDRDRGVKFATYASWWVRKAVLEGLEEQVGAVRTPRYQYEKLRMLQAATAERTAQLGTAPDPADVARRTGLSSAQMDRLHRLTRAPLSMEQTPSGRDGSPLKDLLPDPSGVCPHQSLVRRDLFRRLRDNLSSLGRRQREILILRFGLDGEPSRTLREAGRAVGLSRERVRQLEARALARLRELL